MSFWSFNKWKSVKNSPFVFYRKNRFGFKTSWIIFIFMQCLRLAKIGKSKTNWCKLCCKADRQGIYNNKSMKLTKYVLWSRSVYAHANWSSLKESTELTAQPHLFPIAHRSQRHRGGSVLSQDVSLWSSSCAWWEETVWFKVHAGQHKSDILTWGRHLDFPVKRLLHSVTHRPSLIAFSISWITTMNWNWNKSHSFVMRFHQIMHDVTSLIIRLEVFCDTHVRS